MLDDRVRHIDHAHERAAISAASATFIAALPTQVQLMTTGGPLLLCHGVLDNDLGKVWPGSERMPPERSPGLDRLIEQNQFRLLINGHMHYRIVLDFPGLTHINAGTLAPRHRPGVTLLDATANEICVYEFAAEDPRALTHTKTAKLFDSSRHQWANTAAFDSPTEPARLPLTLYS